jgi:hypothetical protein
LRIILAENEITRDLPGKYLDSYEFADGRLEFRWKGVSLPYSVFDKDQRVTHAAITENKHLSAVLEYIKAEQDKAPPKVHRVGKQRTRYTPRGTPQQRLELAGGPHSKGACRSTPGMTLSQSIWGDIFRKGSRSGFLRATGMPKAAALNECRSRLQ